MNLHSGSQLQGGRYRIEKVLGTGGFGITYLAEQAGLGRKVAIKEFFMKELCNRNADTSYVSVPSVGSRELVGRFRDKFLKEARSIASLEHKNIVPIIDVFEENGTAYYVMKYVGGGSLGDKVKSGALPEADAVRYIRQVASALDFVHSKHIMHLDVKPANVLLSDDNDAVLIDFGLAKQYDDAGTQTSTTPVGISHGYAPLEQYKRGGVATFSPATDIYSLGATLYKLVTGITPPEANDVANDGLPELPQHLSSNVRAAIEAAMQFRRKDRPQSIGEFLEIVESGKLKDESGKWRDDIVQGTNEGDSEVTFAFREKPSTSTIERSTEETHLAGAVISSASEKSQFSGSCHPERSEPSVDARRGQSQGTYKHANREILHSVQNDKGGNSRQNGAVDDAATVVASDNISAPEEKHSFGNTEHSEATKKVQPQGKRKKKPFVKIMLVAAVLLAIAGAFALLPRDSEDGSLSLEQKKDLMDKYISIGEYHNGLAVVCSSETECGGIIDKTGKEVVPCKYNDISNPVEGYYRVGIYSSEDNSNKYGFIDSKGNVVVPVKYSYTNRGFSDGLVAVRNDSLWGFVDKNGKEVIRCQYDAVSDFRNGSALAAKNGTVGFIDKNGSWLSDVMELHGFNSESYLKLIAVGDYYFIYHNGNTGNGPYDEAALDINGKYYDIGTFDFRSAEALANPLFIIGSGEKFAIADKNLKVIAPYGKYDSVDDDVYMGYSVSKNGKWGCLDLSGKEIVPCKYANAWMISKKLARVETENGYEGVVNDRNEVVVPLDKYDEILYYMGIGIIKVIKGGEATCYHF